MVFAECVRLIESVFCYVCLTERRLDFEKRRKLHYNEFEALKLARKLMEEEEEEDDDGTSANKTDDQCQQASASGDKSDGKNEVDMDNDHS